MKNTLIMGLIIIIFGLVISNIIQLNEENTIIENKTLKCNLNTSALELQLNRTEQNLKKNIINFQSTCNPSYTIELPTDPLDNILQSVSNLRNYELDKYDCTEFTTNMVNQLKEAGFKARNKYVTVNCNLEYWNSSTCGNWKNNHEITQLTIYVESTNGKIILPNNYYLYGLK